MSTEKKSPMEVFLTTEGCLGRGRFFLRVAVTLIIAILLSMNFWQSIATIGAGGEHPGLFVPFSLFLTIVTACFASGAILVQCIRRLRDAGKPPILSALIFIPGLNVLALIAFLALPSRT